jgi:hypothetical protein
MNKSGETLSIGTTAPQLSDEKLLDVAYLLRVLFRWSWVILLATGLGAAKGLWDMHHFQPMSRAIMVVAPIEGGQTQATPSTTGVGGIVGSLGGLSITTQQSATEFDELTQIMTSLRLAEILQEKYGLMERVFGTSWSDLQASSSEGLGWRRRVNDFLKFNPPSEPTIEDLAGFIKGSVRFDKDTEGPYKEFVFTHRDPEQALWFLTTVFDEATSLMRRSNREETLERRRFLEERLGSVDIIDIRRGILQLISDETRKEMMSQGSLPIGAKIVDGPYVSKYRTEPRMSQYVAMPMFVGFTISAVLVLVIALYRSE